MSQQGLVYTHIVGVASVFLDFLYFFRYNLLRAFLWWFELIFLLYIVGVSRFAYGHSHFMCGFIYGPHILCRITGALYHIIIFPVCPQWLFTGGEATLSYYPVNFTALTTVDI